MWIDKDQENKNLEQNPSDNTAIGSGGGAAPVSSSTTPATGTPSSTSSAGQAAPQRFGTIQDYFKGNKAQGEQLGEQFTTKLGQEKQQQQNAIGEAATGAANTIAANTVNLNPDLLSKSISDPTKIAGNEADFNKFMQQWNASYNGPESFESSANYEPAAKATQAATEKATQLESTGGRQQALQDEFGVYGQGNKGLDEALLQQSNYFPKVQEQSKEFNSLQDYLKKQSEDLSTQAQQAKQTTQATKESTQNAFLNPDVGVLSQFQSDLGNKVNQAKQTATERGKAVQDLLSRPVGATSPVSEAALKDLGLTQDEYNTLRNQQYQAAQGLRLGAKNAATTVAQDQVDLNRYATLLNPNAQVSLENTMSQADYDKALALAKLTQNQNVLPLINPANIGTGANVVNFDKNSLQAYLAENQAKRAAADLAFQNTPEAIAARKALEKLKQNPTPGYVSSQPILSPSDRLSSQPIINPPVNTTPQPSVLPPLPVSTPPASTPSGRPRAFNEGGEVKDLQEDSKRYKR